MKMGLWWIKLVVLGMKDIRKYVVQVSCDQSGGEGGVSQKLTFAHKGGGGGLRGGQICSRDTWTAPKGVFRVANNSKN